jgi:hypothetical protein
MSVSPADDPRFLACRIFSENLTQFDFGDFPHHPLKTNTSMILNDPSRALKPGNWATGQGNFDSGTCGHVDLNVWEYHHA